MRLMLKDSGNLKSKKIDYYSMPIQVYGLCDGWLSIA